MIEEEQRFEIKLTTLETLFVDSPTGGLSIFRTLSLPEEDEGSNDALVRDFKSMFTEYLSKEEIDYHLQNIKEIRQAALEDENLMIILEDKINEISSRIAINLVNDENILEVAGETDQKED